MKISFFRFKDLSTDCPIPWSQFRLCEIFIIVLLNNQKLNCISFVAVRKHSGCMPYGLVRGNISIGSASASSFSHRRASLCTNVNLCGSVLADNTIHLSRARQLKCDNILYGFFYWSKPFHCTNPATCFVVSVIPSAKCHNLFSIQVSCRHKLMVVCGGTPASQCEFCLNAFCRYPPR